MRYKLIVARTWVLLAAAILSGVSLASPRAARSHGIVPSAQLPRDLHQSVASDGTNVRVVDASRHEEGEYGFEGSTSESMPEGIADDALAEFYGSDETSEDLRGLMTLPPATAGVGQESIIGTDTRVRITPTTNYPARATALITFDGGFCTGWISGPDIVMTAGHCVHTGGTGGSWRTNVRVYPGRNGTSSPYGSCSARRLYSVGGWVSSRNENYDYGAVKLNCTIGYTTGWFGYWWQSPSLTGLSTTINGYPGDKPLEQWRSADYVRATESREVYYANDTVGGMSGSPVYNYRASGSSYCTGYCSMAIHAYGLHGSYPHSSYNHGTRITHEVFNNMQSWKSAP